MSSSISSPTQHSRIEQNLDEVQEVGFGKIAERGEVPRLLHKDGSFCVEKHGLSFFESANLYHTFLTISWGKFFLLCTAIYLVTNIVFGALYFFIGTDALSGVVATSVGDRFIKSLFFSVQTLSTIGYGSMSPQSNLAHALVTVQSILGLFEVALITGVIFARFARPTARLRFSEKALIAPFQGKPSFQFRLINLRLSQILQPKIQVMFSTLKRVNGIAKRDYQRLPLYLDRIIFFPIYWTVTHPIDEESPLYGLSEDDLADLHAEFLILFEGVDESTSDTVYVRTSYRFDEVVFGAKFNNMFMDLETGQPQVDVNLLSSYSDASLVGTSYE